MEDSRKTFQRLYGQKKKLEADKRKEIESLKDASSKLVAIASFLMKASKACETGQALEIYKKTL